MQTDTSTLINNPFVPPAVGCPINDLPIELLAQIFSWGVSTDNCRDDDDEDDEEQEIDNALSEWTDSEDDDDDDDDDDDEYLEGDERKSRSRPPSQFESQLQFQVLVSHVCRLWRDVAINSPAFWTDLFFTEGPPFDKSRTWIKRSQNLPLNIHIDCVNSDDDSSEDVTLDQPVAIRCSDDLSTIFDIIQPHVGRWHTLEAMVSIYGYMHLILTRLSECEAAPQLEVLQLYHYEDAETSEAFQPSELKQFITPFHGIAPKLTTVSLWGVHIRWPTLLSNLLDLELAYHAQDVRPSWEEFSFILRSSPKLDTLSLCMSGPATLPMEITEEEIIELPALTNLVLAYHEPRQVSRLVELLLMPNLRQLALDLEEGDFSSFATELASASPGKTKSLLAGIEHLKIASLPCDHVTIKRMYEQLVNLKSINLCCTFLDDKFFRLLIPSSGQNSSNVYCPNLGTITTSGICGGLMKELVAARMAAGCSIRDIMMSEDDMVEDEDEKWLRDQVQSFGYYEPSDEEDDDEITEMDMMEEVDEQYYYTW